jgi:glutamyl-tRNA synthetase
MEIKNTISAKKYNTRFAPSPSGDLHLGGCRTAYFNWLAARASGGKFILRIDDTNPEKNKPEYVDVILGVMDWLKLDYDEIYYQSKRFDRYREMAEYLINQGKAKRLDDGAVVLCPESIHWTSIAEFLGAKPTGECLWHDEIAGWIKITAEDWAAIENLVLMRSNDTPTYHFASCVDDMDTGVNYILRGVDHISNTSRQIYILAALAKSFEPAPKFAHVGLIHFEGRKLSKRDGSASMLYYKEKGYHPEAMLNFMARLCWGPTVDDKTTKMLPRERMLELFLTGGKMKSSPANMDMAKLDSFDRKYKAQEKNHG